MPSIKLLAAGGVAALLVGTRAGREQLSGALCRAKGLLGRGCAEDDGAAHGPKSAAEEVFSAEHPTPGTVAAAVGAPNAPDLEAR